MEIVKVGGDSDLPKLDAGRGFIWRRDIYSSKRGCWVLDRCGASLGGRCSLEVLSQSKGGSVGISPPHDIET